MSLRTDIIDDFIDGRIGNGKVITRQEIMRRYKGGYAENYLAVILSNSEISRNHSPTYKDFTIRVSDGVYKIHPEIIERRKKER